MLGLRWTSALVLALSGFSFWGCAAGKQDPTGAGGAGGETTTSSTTTTSTTSSSSDTGAGGSGGTGGAGGTSSGGGGAGGTTTGTGGTTTSTGNEGGSGGTGGSGGSPPTETALVLAASATEVLGAELHPGGTWEVSSPGEGSSHRPAAALLDAQTGVGLYRQPSDGSLLFVKWAANGFAAPLAIGGLAKTVQAPSIVPWADGAAAAYIATDFKHYFARYGGPMSGWSPSAEPILANNIHSFGPSAPAVAIVGGEVVVAYAGDNGNLYDQKRLAGVWQGANGHGVDGTVTLTPSIVAIPVGPTEALIAYVRSSDQQVMFTLRNGGVWTTPAAVQNALSADPLALTSVGDNGAALAFRGLDSNLYTCLYTPGNDPPWSGPKAFGATTSAPPALARGIDGRDAELVFVSGGQVQHARLSGGAWSAAEAIGGADVTSVTLTTFAP